MGERSRFAWAYSMPITFPFFSCVWLSGYQGVLFFIRVATLIKLSSFSTQFRHIRCCRIIELDLSSLSSCYSFSVISRVNATILYFFPIAACYIVAPTSPSGGCLFHMFLKRSTSKLCITHLLKSR